MAGGVGGSNARARAGKFKKPTRGGGKNFSSDIRPLDAEGNEVSMWAVDSKKDKESDSDDDDSSEEETSEEDSDDDGPGPGPSANANQTADAAGSRENRKAEKKARQQAAIARQKARTVEVGDMPSSSEESEEESEDDDDMPANPNHSKAARKQAATTGVDDITEGVDNLSAAPSRRERETLEAAAAKERHMRLTAQGKTDEAKADLARLKLIREQRALEAARRQAEREEREEQEKIKKAEIDSREAKKREAAVGSKNGKKK